MPFQPGNRLGAKEKLFHKALLMELRSSGEDMPSLRKIARNLIKRASDERDDANPLPAIKEFADRLDGKADATIHTDVSGITLFEAFLDALEAKRRHELNGGSGVTIEHEPAALCNGHSEGGT